MPKYIVKLTDKKTNTDYYMEWSTVVDAPVTFGLSREAFEEYYQERYRPADYSELSKRMNRVEKWGTSSIDGETAEEMIIANRAGENETELTYEEILNQYCITPSTHQP